MKNAQKPDHVSLNTLIGRLKEGRFVVPDFQREFEWRPWDIRDLMRSIFLDYYIGSLLLWKGKKENFESLSCEPIYGLDGEKKPEYIVLDGQQRLTAMYYSFLSPDIPLPNRSKRAFYFLRIDRFMNEQFDEAFHYDFQSKRFLNILDEKEAQYATHIFPFSVIGAGGWELPNWVQGYERYWAEIAMNAQEEGDTSLAKDARRHSKNAMSFGEHVKAITEEYQISYIELDQDLEVDKVCDIFTQINSRGIRLDVFDLVNALLKPKGLQLKKMWRKASQRLGFVETEKMNVYILQVMSILRQTYCSPKYLYFLLPGQEKSTRDSDGVRKKEILIKDINDFENRWNEAVDSLENAIKLLRHPQEFGAISSKYLPYVSILPVFSALQTYVKNLSPHKQLDARRKLHYWYWASVFMNRYSGAVESTSARDYLDVKAWIEDDHREPWLLEDFKTRFRGLDFRKETKRSTSVYNGIFNLLVLQGARDWMTGNVPQHDDLDDHHIVPFSWGNKVLSGNIIHSILNRTPLTSLTNRQVISDRLPNSYLPELISYNGEKMVRAIMDSHFISAAAQSILMRDPFTAEDFDEFISERQRTFTEAIENLLIKERLDLTPQLRELDESLESVELKLRKVIGTRLDDNPENLPSHVEAKVKDRIQKAIKKNATLDPEYYSTLEGMLQYFDLRELQDTITNKKVWPEFEVIFKNKEILSGKFGQIAELRNGIRHSRIVDEIVTKEGEAAILWFEKVLAK